MTLASKKQFEKLLDVVTAWIEPALATYAQRVQPVAAARFARLPHYYPDDLLNRIGRVTVAKCPVPPLAQGPFPQLAEIENWDLKGVPWQDTIFIRNDLADWEPVHFHEILHVVQWRYLGARRYLTAWAVGTITKGYRANPLEEMAFRHQARFETDQTPYDVVTAVKTEIDTWPDAYFSVAGLA